MPASNHLTPAPATAAAFGTAIKRWFRSLGATVSVKVSGSTKGGARRSPEHQFVSVYGEMPEVVFTAALDLLYPNREHNHGMGNIRRNGIAIHGYEWAEVEKLVLSLQNQPAAA